VESKDSKEAKPKKDAKKEAKKEVKKRLREVVLTMAEGLRFDPPRFEAKPGEEIRVRLENADPAHLAHNFVVVQPGRVQEVVQVAMAMGEAGPGKGFVPAHPAILLATQAVVDPEKRAELELKLPAEPGVYGYVCTVPGHGMIMYGAIYVGVPMPPLAKDMNIPQVNLERGLVGGGRRPFVQRIFVPESGPASIAVALPGKHNVCFDAGACYLRFAWSGAFLDASAHWRGSGNAVAELGDLPWWRASGFPLKVGEQKGVKFLGYTLSDGIPEFHFRLGSQEVFERITSENEDVVVRFRLPGVSEPVRFTDGKGSWSSSVGSFAKGVLEVPVASAKEFTVVLKAGAAGSNVHSNHKTPAKP
jgi:uncharacterized cupredoxin-like copper-binding protein